MLATWESNQSRQVRSRLAAAAQLDEDAAQALVDDHTHYKKPMITACIQQGTGVSWVSSLIEAGARESSIYAEPTARKPINS